MIKSGYDEICSTRLPFKLYAASKALDLSLFWDLSSHFGIIVVIKTMKLSGSIQ